MNDPNKTKQYNLTPEEPAKPKTAPLTLQFNRIVDCYNVPIFELLSLIELAKQAGAKGAK